MNAGERRLVEEAVGGAGDGETGASRSRAMSLPASGPSSARSPMRPSHFRRLSRCSVASRGGSPTRSTCSRLVLERHVREYLQVREHARRHGVRIVDDDQGDGLEHGERREEVAQRGRQIVARRLAKAAARGVGARDDAEIHEHRLEQVARGGGWFADNGDERAPAEPGDERAAERRLAGARVPDEQHRAVAAFERGRQIAQHLIVGIPAEMEAWIRRRVERVARQTVEPLVERGHPSRVGRRGRVLASQRRADLSRREQIDQLARAGRRRWRDR